MNQLTDIDIQRIAGFQKNEITEHHIYDNLSKRVSGVRNRRILTQIASDELRHYEVWKRFTGRDVAPNRFRIWFYSMISILFGFTFGIKLMESGEMKAQDIYMRMEGATSEVNSIIRDEEEHEQALITLLDEERLQYTGSIVLGLNDALVELTGALAGLTFALQNTSVVVVTASITGFAAALSMAASEYLSTKSESGTRNPVKASIYTGIAYIFAVTVLILPYLIFQNLYLCLGLAFAGAMAIIALFNFYISVAQGVPFRSRFLEMAGLILVVAGISFAAGLGIRMVFGIEV
ncbi:MAG: rubrerythrin family protein [Chlorobiaceae bacterium]|nr:rubrerythrin family protein [Chlorobiaceae bacterium]NTV25505.1 rubrerythrin family protein [Chlorobiaceae bacterium]